MKDQIEATAKKALNDLSVATHAHIVENVQSKLHSTREKYLQALSITEVGDDTWLISLDAKATWIEEGMKPHSMVEDLLSSPKARTTKTGAKILSIPFEHNKGPSKQTPAQKSLTDTIKAEFSNRNIPFGGVEKDPHGQPKQGLLHSFDIKDRPNKTANVPGQGKGPIGQPMQGPTGIPFLKGIKVYQHEKKDQHGNSRTQKAIMTFRTVSSNHIGTEHWYHPGLEPKHFFEEAEKWALEQWETVIKDKIFLTISKG